MKSNMTLSASANAKAKSSSSSPSLGPSLAAILYAGMLEPQIGPPLARRLLSLRSRFWLAKGFCSVFILVAAILLRLCSTIPCPVVSSKQIDLATSAYAFLTYFAAGASPFVRPSSVSERQPLEPISSYVRLASDRYSLGSNVLIFAVLLKSSGLLASLELMGNGQFPRPSRAI